MMERGARVLMVVTSHDRIDADHPTGLWLEEFAVPYHVFREAGAEVTVCSPRGGPTPIDPNSSPTDEQEQEWAEARERLQHTLPLEAVDTDDFDAIFLPGGHGTMFDLPDSAALQRAIADIAAAGGVVAAVCHGPAGLVNGKRSDGAPLVRGRKVTAFTDAEEREVKLDQAMPFLLESRLRELGAQFVAGPNWSDHTIVDGLLVTGQNPQSSRSAAEAVVRLLESRAAVQRAA